MRRLINDAELFAAALSQTHVSVYDPETGELIDCGATIVKFTPVSVKIGDAYYVRSANEFRVEISS